MKLRNLLPVIAIVASGSAFGAAGIFDSFVFTTTTGATPLAFHDIGATTGNPDFQGSNLGTFTVGASTLQIGGQQRSFKNNSTDVTSHSISWRVWSGTPTGSFTAVSMPFQFNIGGGGDQQWGGDSQGANSDPIEISTNVLSGLVNGTYTLEVFSQITTNGVNAASTIFNNNGGANYQATFTVVPEPASAVLGLIGSMLLLRRRRF
ncbi:MAG: hypothetical protein ACRCXD_12770 [Luteolibacter sp.]